nr:hypothetical protein [Achromobacter ruhlandii]
MHEIPWLVLGLILGAWADWICRSWRRRTQTLKRSHAEKILLKNGLTPQLYLPTIGDHDVELRTALDEFSFSGYIITDARSEVVGKLCPKVVRGPHLRLVISNE